jgi:hypothetical protein
MPISRGMLSDKVQCLLNPSSKCIYSERFNRFLLMLQTQSVTSYVFAAININIAVFLN